MLSFGPDGITGHADHRAVGAWTAAAFDRAAPPGARLFQAAISDRYDDMWGDLMASLGIHEPGFPVLAPLERLAVDLDLDPPAMDRKVRALAAQTSQTAGLIAQLGAERYSALVAEEAFVERVTPGSPYALSLSLRSMAARASASIRARSARHVDTARRRHRAHGRGVRGQVGLGVQHRGYRLLPEPAQQHRQVAQGHPQMDPVARPLEVVDDLAVPLQRVGHASRVRPGGHQPHPVATPTRNVAPDSRASATAFS